MFHVEFLKTQISFSLKGIHSWYISNHARPTFCNVCHMRLDMMLFRGVSCEGFFQFSIIKTNITLTIKCANSKRTSHARQKRQTTVNGQRLQM